MALTILSESLTNGQTTSGDCFINRGYFNLSISGTFTGTVTIQRSADKSTWVTVETYTAPTEEVGNEGEDIHYRASYSGSGTATVRFGQDRN
jgi:hypothetical protein